MTVTPPTRPGGLPYALASTVFLSQVGVGIILFAVFQEYVPAHLNADAAWSGYLLAAYGGARFVTETPAGALSDRIDRRLGLLAGYTLMVPAIVLMALVPNRHAYLVFAAQLGFATAFLWPAVYAISADLYPPERRGKVIGLLNLAQLLGFGVGALAGALLVERTPTSMFAVSIVAVAAAFVVTSRHVPPHARAPRPAQSRRPPFRSMLSRRLIMLSAIIVIISSALSMLVPAIRPFGEEQLGASFATVTIMLIPAIVLGAALFIPAGHIADRHGRTLPLIAGQGLLLVGLLAIAETRSLPMAAFWAVFVFAGNVLAVPAWNAAIMDLAPEAHRGAIIGLSVALNGFGLAIGPAVGGIIVSESGAPAVFRTAAGLCAVAGIAIAAYSLVYRDSQSAADTSAASQP